MTRGEALTTLNTLIKNPNLIKHHFAAEAVMKNLALYFKNDPKITENIDPAKWAMVGLLHDADYDLTRNIPEKHALLVEESLAGKIEPEIIYAIKAHNWDNNGVEPKSLMDWSMYCCDELTGLIVAAALVHPNKRLSSINTEFVMNRFNEKSFAKGAQREHIKMCEEKLGIPLEKFIDLALKAMQEISTELEL